jgi:predicted nucleotidyltransferase
MESEHLNQKIINYLLRFNPSRIGIFGSYARGEIKKSSDIDLLVDFRMRFGLLQLVRIERELSNILGIKVDLVTEKSLKNQKLKAYILNDLQIIYE